MNDLRDATRVRVSVPATSANLGPGFDCAGVALDIRDSYSAEVTFGAEHERDVAVTIHGEGADGSIPRDENNLVVQAMLAGLSAWGGPAVGAVRLTCHNRIAHGRGLGSSSAAIVGGLGLARALLADSAVSDAALLAKATEIEGHPDNVAAAVHGGFTISWLTSSGSGAAVALPPTSELTPILAIPHQSLSTSHARGLVPADVAMTDAVFNLSRSALLTAALTVAPEHIFTATEDRLHQDPRSSAYPASHALMTLLRTHGHAAAISGAGPTVIALVPTAHRAPAVDEVSALAGTMWQVRAAGFSMAGVRVESGQG